MGNRMKTLEKKHQSEKRKGRRRAVQQREMTCQVQGLKEEVTALQTASRKALKEATKRKYIMMDILRHKNRSLGDKLQCARKGFERAKLRAKQHPHLVRLTRCGIYTPEACTLACAIVQSGCAREKVGKVMTQVAKAFGITIKRSMSQRTVSRCILEGGLASKIQAGYQMKYAKSMTLSGDSTSHREVNYNARHLALQVPDYRAGDLTGNTMSAPVVQLLGVDSSVDHSSETSLNGWKGKFEEIPNLLAESPLGQRMPKFTVRDVVKIIKGMNGDHASNEKSTADRIKEWKDIATLTELASMALYSQAVSHPYMCVVRGPGTENINVLDLKSFHISVWAFIQGIIEEPTLLVSSEMSVKTGSLDGKDWEQPDVIAAIQKLTPSLPHLQEVTVAFFKGSLSTWIRFTAEFAPGGLIDTANSDELALAWMPTTNNPNEGQLGGFRVQICDTPTLTMHQYSAKAMYTRNDTQAFMDAVLTKAADHLFLMRKARQIDASSLEKKCRRAQVEFYLQVVKIQCEKEAGRKRQEIQELYEYLTIQLLHEAEVNSKTVKILDQQLGLLQNFGDDSDIPKLKKDRGIKASKQTILKKALQSYYQRQACGADALEVKIRARLRELEAQAPEDDAPCLEWDEEEEIEMEE